MPRYEHYLTPTKGNVFPQAVIGLACDLQARPNPCKESETVYDCSGWYCDINQFSPKNGWVGRCVSGSSPNHFWDELRRYCTNGGEFVLASYQTAICWPAIGIFERLESGYLTFDRWTDDEKPNLSPVPELQDILVSPLGVVAEQVLQTDVPEVPKGMDECRRNIRRGRRKAGKMDAVSIIVLENPPNILCCRIRGCKTRLRFVDLANYGIECYSSLTVGMDQARLAAQSLVGIIDYLKANNLGTLKSTAASQAMFSYRRKYLNTAILAHTHQSAMELERKAYYGGRCEAFRIGHVARTVVGLDIRSSYPSCYTRGLLPTRLVSFTTFQGRNCRRINQDWSNSIADVLLNTRERIYPCRKKDLIIYPIGQFRTVLAGPELEHAARNDHIVECYAIASYHLERCLETFGKDIYGSRCTKVGSASDGSTGYYKRLLNSIVGKFGQREKNWIDVQGYEYHKPWGYWTEQNEKGEQERYRCVAWTVQRESVGLWANDAIPAMSCWITSLARMKLLQYMTLAGMSNILYVDTDALIVNRNGYQNLLTNGVIQNGVLGKLELRNVADSIDIYGIKHYRMGMEYKASCVPLSARVENSDTGKYIGTIGPMEFIRKGLSPSNCTYTANIIRDGKYKLGTVESDGTVSPLVLAEREQYAESTTTEYSLFDKEAA